MMEDVYEPLGRQPLPGFAHGLLVGLDAGLAVKASDRPQSIAGWRPVLGQTIADGRAITAPMPQRMAGPAAAPPPVAAKQRKSLWAGRCRRGPGRGGGGRLSRADTFRALEAASSRRGRREAAGGGGGIAARRAGRAGGATAGRS